MIDTVIILLIIGVGVWMHFTKPGKAEWALVKNDVSAIRSMLANQSASKPAAAAVPQQAQDPVKPVANPPAA